MTVDAEFWKSFISAVSAIVAILSAYYAHRAKVQTRGDLFEILRNQLIVAMVENNCIQEKITLDCAFGQSQLADAMITMTHPPAVTMAGGFATRLMTIFTTVSDLRKSKLSIEDVEQLTYSEENIGTMRQQIRDEQVLATRLATYPVHLEHLDKFLKSHKLQ